LGCDARRAGPSFHWAFPSLGPFGLMLRYVVTFGCIVLHLQSRSRPASRSRPCPPVAIGCPLRLDCTELRGSVLLCCSGLMCREIREERERESWNIGFM
jgi:hypothetical protein